MLTESDILTICNGNVEAAGFVNAFVAYCHAVDDVFDKDKTTSDEEVVRTSLAFMEQLLLNPWAKERQALIWPLVVAGFNAWLDANKWEAGNPEQRRDADVVKGFYHEVVWFVAYLCGGWDHLRRVTAKYRGYDHDSLKKG